MAYLGPLPQKPPGVWAPFMPLRHIPTMDTLSPLRRTAQLIGTAQKRAGTGQPLGETAKRLCGNVDTVTASGPKAWAYTSAGTAWTAAGQADLQNLAFRVE